MLRSPWFLQLCKKQCTFFYRYVYVLQIRLLKHQYSKTVWSKLFLCNTYTNHIAVVKEVDLGFKLILYKYCFIIVKSILFQIWNIIRQYFLTPPNKKPNFISKSSFLKWVGLCGVSATVAVQNKSVFHFLKVNRFFYHPNKPNSLPPGTVEETSKIILQIY